MNTRNYIQDELNELQSSLPSSADGRPFHVPEGYFESLASLVMARIKNNEATSTDEIAELSPLLAGISRKMPLSVPDQYFSANVDAIAGITDTEEIMTFPVSKEMPYAVPQDYFTNLPVQILVRVSSPKAKVITMFPKKFMRVAAAAIVAGIITISGIFYLNGRNGNNHVSVDNPSWVASKLKNVSDKDIEEFVNTADVNQVSMVTVKKPARADVKKLLQDVSDKELDAFLDQLPVDDEMIAIN